MKPTNLSQYFQQQGKPLPSVQDRAPLYAQYGITSAPGSASANIQLLAALQGGGSASPAASPAPAAQTQPAQANDLFSQYQPRLAAASQQSNDLLSQYLDFASQAPTFAQKLLDSIKQSGQYPNQATFREELAQNPNLTPLAIEAQVSRRGQFERGTIMDLINRAVGGFEADVAARQGRAQLGQQQRSNLLEDYGLQYRSQQDALNRADSLRTAGRGTAGQRAENDAMQQAQSDASRGATSEQLARAYGSVLEPWKILQVYNEAGVYGPIENLDTQFYKWLPGYEGEEGESPQLTAGQTSDIRAEAISDIQQAKNTEGYNREELKRQLKASYPELRNEIDGLLESFWPEEGEVETGRPFWEKYRREGSSVDIGRGFGA